MRAWCLISVRIKNDNCVVSPCRAEALSAASRLVLASNANWNYLKAQAPDAVFVSVMTIGEIAAEIEKQRSARIYR